MHPKYRDGVLATGGLVGLVALAAATGGVGQLLVPAGIAVGILAAVSLEVVFLRYPSRTLALWERRGVPLLGLCVVFAAGVVAVRLVPWLLAVPVWGLLTYLALLGCVLVGLENPVSLLLDRGE